MHCRTSQSKWFTGWLGLALCLALSLLATPAAGADRYWIGGSGFWSEDANWSPYGQPINGDNVYLTQSDATSRMVFHYNWRYPGAVANNLWIDATGSGTMTLYQGFVDHPLDSNYEYVGYYGTGKHWQNLGINTVSNILYLGYNPGSSGAYELSGGSLAATIQCVGLWGTGLFTQSGGTNTASTAIILGGDAAGTGTYELSGGSLAAGLLSLGHFRSRGLFKQTGGTNALSQALCVGGYVEFGIGAYELSGGSLAAPYQYIGYNLGYGTFTQSGGTNTVSNALYVTSGLGRSTYELSGGSLAAKMQYIGGGAGGTFTQSGGDNTASTGIALGYFAGYNGAYDLSGGSLAARDLGIGYSGRGLFKQSGGTNAVTYSLVQGYLADGQGAYELSGGSLAAQVQVIGFQGTGAFTQTGGANTASSELDVGYDAAGRGAYELRGGSLSVWNLNIGYYGTGAFIQSGGANTVSSTIIEGNGLFLGFHPGGRGAYELSGGSLLATSLTIGRSGTGAFIQTGGANTVSGFLALGYGLGSSGTYELRDGSLSAPQLVIGRVGEGAFKQSGGTNAVSNSLYLLGIVGSIYELSGGSLSAPNQYIGNASFTQSGGTNTVADTLTLGGTYQLQGGALNAGTIDLWPNGIFNQTGGSLNAATFNQQGGEVQGSLENRGVFNYLSGTFSGRLRNYGAVNFDPEFTLGNGLANYVPLTIPLGKTLTLNGLGLDNQGSLAVNGVLTGSGPLLNNTGGVLSGSGTILGNLTNRGTVSPGNSPGTISVVGNYIQTATGTYVAEVASANSYDRIVATGTATLAGTIAPILYGGFKPRGNQVFPGVLTATGGINGTFSTILNQQFTPTLFWQTRYNPNSVDLWVQRNYTNAGLALNTNQAAVGSMLNSFSGVTSGDLDTVLNAIDYLPDSAAVRDAYKQIASEKAGALTNLGFGAANFQMRNLANRTTNLRFLQGTGLGGSSLNGGGLSLSYSRMDGVMLAYNGASVSNLFSGSKEIRMPDSRWGLFVDGGGAFGHQSSSVNQTGYNFSLGGFTAGADYRLRDNLLLGLATGYSNSNAGFNGSGGNVNTNSIPFNAYVAYMPGSLYAYGSLGYALNLYNLKRGINFNGITRNASSSTTGNQFNLYGETGYDVKLKRVILTPSATLAFSSLWVGGFTEQGAGVLNLKVAPQSATSLQTGIGGRFTVPLKAGSVKVIPQVYAYYQHEFEGGSRGLNASLSQGSGAFRFQTDAAKRNYALVGGNVTLGLKKNLVAQLNYNAEVGRGNSKVQSFNAGLRWEF